MFFLNPKANLQTLINKIYTSPKILGNSSEISLFNNKFASVIAKEPPFFLQQTGPGSAPTDSGPILYNPFSKNKREPPPAATVLIFNYGA